MKNLTLRNITKRPATESTGDLKIFWTKKWPVLQLTAGKLKKTICSLPLTVNASTLTNSSRIPLKKAQCA